MRLTFFIVLITAGCRGQVFQGSIPNPRWMSEVRHAKGWLTIEVPADCKKTWYDVVVTRPEPGSKPTFEPDPRIVMAPSMYPQDTIYSGRLWPGESITKQVSVSGEFIIKARRKPREVWGRTFHFQVPSHDPGKDLTAEATVSCDQWSEEYDTPIRD